MKINSFAVLLSVLCIPLALRPSAAKQEEQEFKLTATAELVLLDVGVKDPTGGDVTNLGVDNFRVYENSKLQRITHFSSEDLPVTIGLVVDNSGSMRFKRPEVVTAALTFVAASNRDDEMFVVNFNDAVSRGLPKHTLFTDDRNVLRKALWTAPAAGRTALYDAVLEAMQHLTLGRRSKKALLLVSDGGDTASSHTLRDVIDVVRESQATLYTIGIFDDDDPDRNPDVLRQLARVSGGEAFFPQDLQAVPGTCKQIAQDIRHRYTIGFVPARHDGKGSLRSLKVAVVGSASKSVTVHARTKYFLPARRDTGSNE